MKAWQAACIAAFLGTTSAIAQTTWYVDATNTPPGTGTVGDPFTTIQQGVAAASPLDTVSIAAGLYTGTVDVPIDDLTITGAGAGLTVLDVGGADAGFEITSPPPAARQTGVVIEDLTIQNANRWHVVGWHADSVTLRNLVIVGPGRNVTSTSPGTNAIYGISLSDVTNSLVENVNASACYAGGLAFTGGSTGNVVRDVTLDDNGGDGAGFASLNLFTSPGTSIPGGDVGVTFDGTCVISNTPWAIYVEDTPFGAITTLGTSQLALASVGLGIGRIGLGAVPNLTALTTDLGVRVRLTGTEPALPTGEGYFSTFAGAYAASLLATAPSSALILDLDASTYFVDAGMSIQLAIDASTGGETIELAAGTFTENVVLNKDVTLQGAQAGVDARGRVVGSPNPATETILTAATGRLITLQGGSAGATIDGLALVGGTRGIESTSGPIHGVTIQNLHIEGQTSSCVFLNDAGTDVTVHQNVFLAGSGNGTCFHLDTDLFDGFWFTSNHVTRSGAPSDTGFFVDGAQNVRPSVGRAPRLEDNLFTNHAAGANLGTRAVSGGQIAGNTFDGNSFDGLQGGIQNSTVQGNTFSNNGRYGLALTSFGNTNATRGAQNTMVVGNTFTNNATAGILFSSSQAPGTISTNHVNFNAFQGNAVGATYAGSETIDCENNWWGSASGPSGDGPGTGDAVSGLTIDYDPWLACPPDVPTQGVGSAPLGVALGDLDGDGFLDIATANSGSDDVSILTNDGSGGFATPAVTVALNAGDAPSALAIGDLIAGGNPEIAVLAPGANALHVVNAAGVQATFPLPGIAPNGLCVTDLNGLGTDDVVVAMQGSPLGGGGGLVVILDGGGTVLLAPPVGGTWPTVVKVVCCDLDGDSDEDLAALVSANTAVTPPGDVVIYENDGSGGFAYAGALSLGLVGLEFGLDLTCADIDANGRNDLAATLGGLGAGGKLAVLLHDGSSSLSPGAFALSTFPTSRLGTNLASTDLGGDSYPGYHVANEVVTVNPTEGLITILDGFDGTSFQGEFACVGGTAPTALAIGLLDEDCLPEIVVCDAASGEVLIIPGGGTALAQTYGTGCAGSSGTPVIGVTTPPVLGDPSFAITLSNARSFSLTILIGGTGPGVAPGGCTNLLVDPALLFFPAFTSFAGTSTFQAPIPNDPVLDCGELNFQWAIADPGGSLVGAYALSNGLRLRLGD
ncbi:MAG: right-handed parallel beta-helix repeat-containing protein [Planctomycetes bacterium]|nr:right-handed parallel beta-helix repeat-containing protein [Planctomycetota bacterium]